MIINKCKYKLLNIKLAKNLRVYRSWTINFNETNNWFPLFFRTTFSQLCTNRLRSWVSERIKWKLTHWTTNNIWLRHEFYTDYNFFKVCKSHDRLIIQHWCQNYIFFIIKLVYFCFGIVNLSNKQLFKTFKWISDMYIFFK